MNLCCILNEYCWCKLCGEKACERCWPAFVRPSDCPKLKGRGPHRWVKEGKRPALNSGSEEHIGDY